MDENTLHILWTNDNPITAEFMVFMYATNALRHKWWDTVHIIVWGATARLLCENESMRGQLRLFQEAGGHVSACRRCAEKLGVLEQLEAIPDIDIVYIGQEFTRILKSGEKCITI